MPLDQGSPMSRERLISRYREVRSRSEEICAPLAVDDYQVQSILEVSPPKWHLAHVSWFFETFLLRPFEPRYSSFHPDYDYLFNSYYETVGAYHPRAQRGVLSRPTVEQIYAYRRHVDEFMEHLIECIDETRMEQLVFRTLLGLNHEQQHQELLLMDIKHNFALNPLRPAYQEKKPLETREDQPARLDWIEHRGGIYEVGHDAEGFAYDNETPRHRVLLEDYLLAPQLITNGEFLEFIEAGGYQQARYWLADGWRTIRQQRWHAPLYWERLDDGWWQMTLSGMATLDQQEPVCHLSYYEADAFARWRGKRLPTEAELEIGVRDQPLRGNFVESGRLHPSPAGDGQWFGDLWEWTQTPYTPYPGFQPLTDSLGEYNGKFMCNQLVLRGGACVTPHSHMRPTYRNFFYPHDRWQFSGIRLADDG
nr:ergothioneine biosynthesis protein EgtB [Gammaproteobacteria bacterium]